MCRRPAFANDVFNSRFQVLFDVSQLGRPVLLRDVHSHEINVREDFGADGTGVGMSRLLPSFLGKKNSLENER